MRAEEGHGESGVRRPPAGPSPLALRCTRLRRALEGSRRRFGADHPDTLSTLSLLGSVLRDAQRLEEARPIYVESHAVRQRVLGEEHPSTLTSANNLAMLLQDLGRLDEAKSLERETLETQRRVLGDDHDATILSLANLGSILRRQGRQREAEGLLLEALDRCRRNLAPDHALCGTTLRRHARCLVDLGRDTEAERTYRESHTVPLAAYGADHPTTRQIAGELADFYEARDRDDDAAEWRSRAETDGEVSPRL